MHKAGSAVEVAHPDIFDYSQWKMEPRPPTRPHATGRRKISRKEGRVFIVYNGACSGRSLADSVPTQPKSKDIPLFGLKRTQAFSTEFPFLGHAPTSDRKFTGVLGALNVDRREETHFAFEADMERKSRKDDTSSAIERTSNGTVEVSAADCACDTDYWGSPNEHHDNGTARAGGSEIEERLSSAASAIQPRATLLSATTGSEPSMEVRRPTFRDALTNPHRIEHPHMTHTEYVRLQNVMACAARERREYWKERDRRIKARERDPTLTPLSEMSIPRIRTAQPHTAAQGTVADDNPTEDIVVGNSKDTDRNRNSQQRAYYPATQVHPHRSPQTGVGSTEGEFTETSIGTTGPPPYRLCEDESKVGEWAELEDTLQDFIEAMKREKTFGGNIWFLDSRPFRTPASFGYRARRRSEETMRKARAAFLGLIALARMYVEAYRAYFCKRYRVSTGETFDAGAFDGKWTRELHRRHPRFPMAWLDDILRTAVGRDTPGRAGVFVDIRDVYILGVVMYQIELGMPVYIYCNVESQSWISSLDAIDRYQVLCLLIRESEAPDFYRELRIHLGHTRAEEKKATDASVDFSLLHSHGGLSMDCADVSTMAVTDPAPYHSEPVRDPLVRHTAPVPQRLLDIHEADLKSLRARETAKERQGREAREAHAEKTRRCPRSGSKAVHCFEWVVASDGSFARRYVNRSEVRDTWSRFNRFSRRYLSAWNEWDLWHGYDEAEDGSYPAHKADEDLEEGSDSEPEPYSSNASGAFFLPKPFVLDAPDIVWTVTDTQVYERQLVALAHRVEQAQTRRELGAKHGMSTIHERSVKYFGLCAVVGGREGQVRPSDEDIRSTILKLYEIPEWQTKVNALILEDIHRLVRDIELSAGDFRKLNPLLCDLNGQSPQFVLRNSLSPVKVKVHSLARAAPFAEGQRARKRLIMSDSLYVLTEKSASESSWVIAVTEPLVCVRALRFEGEFLDLLKEFLTSGVKLHFLRALRGTDASYAHSSIPRPLPLLKSDTLKAHDYTQYYSRLLAVLAEDTRLQFKALKEGGIVWRLVVQHVDVSNVLENIADAVSVPALDGASVAGMSAVFDDDLTEEEERIICGVYDSSVNPDGAENAIWSWWPRSLIWSKSSAHCGQWTMYNERWFLARQTALEKGLVQGELKMQQQWRNMLDGQKKRGDRFYKASSTLAANFLNDSVSLL